VDVVETNYRPDLVLVVLLHLVHFEQHEWHRLFIIFYLLVLFLVFEAKLLKILQFPFLCLHEIKVVANFTLSPHFTQLSDVTWLLRAKQNRQDVVLIVINLNIADTQIRRGDLLLIGLASIVLVYGLRIKVCGFLTIVLAHTEMNAFDCPVE